MENHEPMFYLVFIGIILLLIIGFVLNMTDKKDKENRPKKNRLTREQEMINLEKWMMTNLDDTIGHTAKFIFKFMVYGTVKDMFPILEKEYLDGANGGSSDWSPYNKGFWYMSHDGPKAIIALIVVSGLIWKLDIFEDDHHYKLSYNVNYLDDDFNEWYIFGELNASLIPWDIWLDDSKDKTEEKVPKKRSRRISQKVKDLVWNRDGGKCVECGSKENLEFDHIIPHSKGGANTYRNIQLLCEPCNRSKSAKIG